MKRAIYEVYAKVVDATGAYNTLSGYPKVYDSHSYDDDVEATRCRACGEYHSVLGSMYPRTDRQLQFVFLIDATEGMVIESTKIGAVPDIPDPKYTLTVTNGQGTGEFVEGEVVYITAAAAPDGMVFSHWEGVDGVQFVGGDANASYASFYMPAENLNVTAVYTEVQE